MRVKAWGPLAALTALIVLVVLGAAVQYSPQLSEHLPVKVESQTSPNGKSVAALASDPKIDEGRWYTDLLKPTDWLLVVFTFLLAIYTRRLYQATAGLLGETAGLRTAADQQAVDMKASIKAATDAVGAAVTSNQIAVTTSEQQLRAYVTAEAVDFVIHRHTYMGANGQPTEGSAHTYQVSVVLRNGGQTPATNVITNVSCASMGRKELGTFGFPEFDLRGHGVIGPGQKMFTPFFRVKADKLQNTPAEVGWYFWGWVEYDDVFTGSIRHRTEFCFEIDHALLPTGEFWVGFKPTERFNAIDWGCSREFNAAENKYG